MGRKIMVGVVAFLVLVAACGGSDDAASQDRDVVRVGLLNVLSFAPFLIADAEGYFEDQGIEIEWVPSESSSTLVAATVAGDVDVLAGTMSAGVINAIVGGADLRIVADKGNLPAGSCTYVGLLGPASVAAEGLAAHHLEGARVGGLRPANLSQGYFLHELLSSLGLPDDAVTTVDISRPALADALASQSIDFAWTGEPWVTRVADAGYPVIIGQEDVTPGYAFGYVAYGPRLLNDQDLGRRFMAGYLSGVARYREGKTPENLEVLAEATQQPEDLLERACWPDIRADGHYDVATLMPALEWAFDAGLIDAVPDAADLLDTSFAEAARSAP